MRAHFGKGTYYLGDICYVMKDEIYDKVWGKEYGYDDGSYNIEKTQFVVSSTAYGDGYYIDTKGRGYGVDAGVIGIVPKALWKCTEKEIKEGKLGSILKIKNKLVFKVDKCGVFEIEADGERFTINTK